MSEFRSVLPTPTSLGEITHHLPGFDILSKANPPQTRRFERGEVLFHQGDPVGGVYIVRNGIAKEYLTSELGENHITGIATVRNPIILGFEGVIDGEPHGYSAEAIIPVIAQYIPRRELHALLRTNPKSAETLLTYFTRRVREKTERHARMVFLDLTAKLALGLFDAADALADYARNKEEKPEITHLTQQDLADMVGASRATVCSLLGYWKDKGYLNRAGRRIIVQNPNALRSIGANKAVLETFPPEESSEYPKTVEVAQRKTA